MTTQPQSPSEQEIRTQVENAITPPVEEVAESGWPNDSFKKAVDDVLVLINQAADKREQEVLEAARAEDAKAAEEYRTSWLMRWTVYDEYIGRRLGRLNRQGKPAEGNK